MTLERPTGETPPAEEPTDKMGTIQHAIFVERSTNPECPIVSDLIAGALKKGDIDFAYEIAMDTLKPRKSAPTRLKEFIKSSRPLKSLLGFIH